MRPVTLFGPLGASWFHVTDRGARSLDLTSGNRRWILTVVDAATSVHVRAFRRVKVGRGWDLVIASNQTRAFFAVGIARAGLPVPTAEDYHWLDTGEPVPSVAPLTRLSDGVEGDMVYDPPPPNEDAERFARLAASGDLVWIGDELRQLVLAASGALVGERLDDVDRHLGRISALATALVRSRGDE